MIENDPIQKVIRTETRKYFSYPYIISSQRSGFFNSFIILIKICAHKTPQKH